MFRLLHYFSVTSGVAVLVVTLLLSYVFYQHEVSKMVLAGEKQNINTARLLANASRAELMSILRVGREGPLRGPTPLQQLDERIQQLARDLPIVKVKFYALDGYTLYSSESRQVGEEKYGSEGLSLAARQGVPSSKLSYREQFSAFSRNLTDIAVVETYIPLFGEEAGEVQAVFELYSDVTSLVDEIEHDVSMLVSLLILAFGLLYAVLFVLVRHADGVLKCQYLTLAEKEGAIRDRNQLLKAEVRQRQQAEAALQSANEMLENKVQERTIELVSTVEELRLENLQREQAEESLSMLSTAVEQSPSSVVIADTNGTIEYANPKFYAVTGYNEQEVIGSDGFMNKSSEMPQQLYHELWREINAGREWRGELLSRKKDGTLFWEAVSISPIIDGSDQITHYVAVKEDISLRKSYENELLRQANYDSLTGLANRLLVKDRLAQAIARAQRTATKVAVLFIDLDDFKKVNDSLGHSAGDELLMETARRLEECVRATDTVGLGASVGRDTVARMGGDEFVVLLTDLEHSDSVEVVAREIQQTLAQPFTVMGHEVFVSNSIGITLFPDDGVDIEVLMRNADLAMYQAKESGCGTFSYFTKSFNETAQERLHLEAALRHAIENGELSLHYQPIIDNHSDTIAGAEALLRWENAELGSVSPARFIPIAERTGLIVEIGRWVLEQGLRDYIALAAKAGGSDFFLSLNVSSRQLRESGFAVEFCELLARHGVAINRIKVEITESLILEDTLHTQSNLAELAMVGARFSVDDFGTGYSSLKYLKKLPVDTLKIDRSFVAEVCSNPDDASLVHSITAMAQGLGIRVIAEGVEEAGQKRFITEAGCHYTQGYFTGAPVPLTLFNVESRAVSSAK